MSQDYDSELMNRPRDKDATNTAVSRSGGWSASGNLITANRLKDVRLQAVFPEAGNYLITFELDRPNIAPNSIDRDYFVDPVAEVNWSVEGNTVKRKLNVASGVSISGAAQGVSIRMRDESVPVNPGPISEEYIVTALVSKGVRAPTEQPPTLIIQNFSGSFVVIIPTATSSTWFIPQGIGAISVNVAVSRIGGGAVIANQSVVVEQTISTIPFKSYDPRDIAWAPLVPGCDIIVVYNESGANILATLTLGIDG